MELVVDTNVLISALVKPSNSRILLCHPRIILFAPEHLLEEIERNKGAILKKSKISESRFRELLASLLSNISLVKADEFRGFLKQALKIAQHPEDSPFLALALAYNIPVWSNDKGFKRQPAVKVFSTRELIEFLRRTAP